jgi:regulatory protein
MDYTDEDEGPRRPSKSRGKQQQQRRGGMGGYKKPKSWLPTPPEDGSEPPPLTDEQREKITSRCMNLCLWHLGQGPRTEKQLRDAMAKHDAPADIIDATMERVVEMGYVNDAEYAEQMVRSRMEYRKQGTMAIRQALRQKGVDDETAALALEEIKPEDEEANARALVEKKLPSTRGLDRNKRANRLVGMLARKGYNGGIAYQVVREALDAEGEDEEYGDVEGADLD